MSESKQAKIQELHQDDNLIFLQGFDDAIVGTALCQGNLVICYSIKKMVENLMSNQGMTDSEAYEWLDFNTLFAYFGEHTPVYLEDYIESV